MDKIKVYIEKTDAEVVLPQYTTYNDAGMDVRANEDYLIGPNQTIIVKTGLKVALPDGIELQVRPRSGLSLNTPLRICNAPGTIDAGYRDEIGIILSNTSKDYYFDNDKMIPLKQENATFYLDSKKNKQGWYHIKKGDRIAQFVFKRVCSCEFEKVDDVSKIGHNRGGGFGHSGHQ